MFGVGTIGSLGSVGAAIGPSYSPQAKALFARFTNQPTQARGALIDNLIISLVSAGVWAKYDAFYILAAADSQAAQLNWVTNTYNLTSVNAPTFAVDKGFTPNGTSSYLDTGFNPVTATSPKFTQNDAYMAAVHLTVLNNAGAVSNDVGNTTSKIIAAVDTTPSVSANRALINGVGGIYNADKAFSRDGASSWRYYNDGGLIGGDPQANASAALTSFNFSIGRTAAASFGLNQCAVFRFGSHLATADVVNEYRAIATYLNAVGAAPYSGGFFP